MNTDGDHATHFYVKLNVPIISMKIANFSRTSWKSANIAFHGCLHQHRHGTASSRRATRTTKTAHKKQVVVTLTITITTFPLRVSLFSTRTCTKTKYQVLNTECYYYYHCCYYNFDYRRHPLRAYRPKLLNVCTRARTHVCKCAGMEMDELHVH